MKIEDLHDKKIAILGFGLEGQSTLRFLQKQGIEDITILDKSDESVKSFWKFDSVVSLLSYQRRKFKCGLWNDYLNSLWKYDLIFKSPGVSPFWEKLLPYREKFISQAHVFFENYIGKVIGVTGTKGKSTISTLLYSCLKEAGYSVKLVGNIGNPVLDEIDISKRSVIAWRDQATQSKENDSWLDSRVKHENDKYDYVVYEMSSYMLQDFQPKLYVWFLNNIYPCHLDWHYDSMNIYKEAKYNILQNAETRIVSSELKDEHGIMDITGEKYFFGQGQFYNHKNWYLCIWEEQIFSSSDILLQWEHNLRNIVGVMLILSIVFDDKWEAPEKVLWKISDTFSQVLPKFWWLPHRIENIWVYEGIRFINDAIATTPESTIAAIDTFWEDLQTLFLWGEDSGFEFTNIREKILHSPIQNIIAFPDTSEKVFLEIAMRDYEVPFELEIEWKTLQIIKTRSMKSAVDFAYKTTFPWKVALLSCAAPSFSLWKNYKEKAAEFIKEVREY